jgi:hypothetical protein
VPVDSAAGSAAGRLRARRYHRTRCAVSMADCIAAETARATGQPLATADPDLLDVCHAESIPSLPLPASDGTTWTPPTNASRLICCRARQPNRRPLSTGRALLGAPRRRMARRW